MNMDELMPPSDSLPTLQLDEDAGRKLFTHLRNNQQFREYALAALSAYFVHHLREHLGYHDVKEKFDGSAMRVVREQHPEHWAHLVDMFDRQMFLICTAMSSFRVNATPVQEPHVECHALRPLMTQLVIAAILAEDFINGSELHEAKTEADVVLGAIRCHKHISNVMDGMRKIVTDYCIEAIKKASNGRLGRGW